MYTYLLTYLSKYGFQRFFERSLCCVKGIDFLNYFLAPSLQVFFKLLCFKKDVISNFYYFIYYYKKVFRQFCLQQESCSEYELFGKLRQSNFTTTLTAFSYIKRSYFLAFCLVFQMHSLSIKISIKIFTNTIFPLMHSPQKLVSRRNRQETFLVCLLNQRNASEPLETAFLSFSSERNSDDES